MAAGRSVPRDVNVIGRVNIVDSPLVEPQLTTIASPLISLGSARRTTRGGADGSRARRMKLWRDPRG